LHAPKIELELGGQSGLDLGIVGMDDEIRGPQVLDAAAGEAP
jgi:hypothetical protein